MIRIASILAVVGLLLASCENGQEKSVTLSSPISSQVVTEGGAEGIINLSVSFAPWKRHAAKLTEIQTIDKATAYVYNTSGTEVTHEDLTLSETRASGRITVPAQENLRVALAYFDGSMVRWIGEDEDVDVPAGGETTAGIVEEYMGISVVAPDRAEIGDDYTVSWMSRPYATEYELQEAIAADFSGAQAFTSADTFRVVSGKSEVGLTYYYRARVNTDYGYGPWHSTGSAVTGMYATGVIIVDVPIPPDEPGYLETELPGGATIDFVWIAPGTYTMGSQESEPGHREEEGPVHEVTISGGFYIGKYEITQGQWESVFGVDAAPWYGVGNVRVGSNFPAVFLSWNDLQEFIKQLNDAAGEGFFRLPTEAEWEYSCRAGTSTRWSFGDDESQLGEYAWYNENAFGRDEKYAHAVGTKKPNPWGLYDMHGNVYEWCQDWYGNYSSGTQTDPTGSSAGTNRIIRGGGFATETVNTRSALRYRYGGKPDNRAPDQGARLILGR